MPHNITLSRQREKQQQQQQQQQEAHIIVMNLNSFTRETPQTVSKCTKPLAQTFNSKHSAPRQITIDCYTPKLFQHFNYLSILLGKCLARSLDTDSICWVKLYILGQHTGALI